MRFKPLSEEEVARAGLLEKGTYPFEVRQAVQKKSKAGNDMIELVLCVWDKNGREYLVYDYLMESSEYKLRHFCYTTGLQEKYDSGELRDTDCLKSGYCKVMIREDKSGLYPPRNSVADYIAGEGEKPVKKQEVLFEDDKDIPF